MAAEVLARELRLDLYRIDLSQVVSKYIGETEKNLRRVFDAAEEGGAILLFDEADALFGKRSEVKDSHDRYANIEVSYLLQRMEGYRGLAILTTNKPDDLDPAFLRRIRFVVQFPFPDAPQLRRDLAAHLPRRHPARRPGLRPAVPSQRPRRQHPQHRPPRRLPRRRVRRTRQNGSHPPRRRDRIHQAGTLVERGDPESAMNEPPIGAGKAPWSPSPPQSFVIRPRVRHEEFPDEPPSSPSQTIARAV